MLLQLLFLLLELDLTGCFHILNFLLKLCVLGPEVLEVGGHLGMLILQQDFFFEKAVAVYFVIPQLLFQPLHLHMQLLSLTLPQIHLFMVYFNILVLISQFHDLFIFILQFLFQRLIFSNALLQLIFQLADKLPLLITLPLQLCQLSLQFLNLILQGLTAQTGCLHLLVLFLSFFNFGLLDAYELLEIDLDIRKEFVEDVDELLDDQILAYFNLVDEVVLF